MKREHRKMRTRSFGTTMGITSIIAILVVLVLVVFSALSIITAKGDLTLSQKTGDNIRSYYAGDSNAQIILVEFGKLISSGTAANMTDREIQNSGKAFEKGNGYEYDDSSGTFRFTVPIENSKKLTVEVTYNNRGEITEKLLWQVSPTAEWETDNSMNLFTP